MKYVEIGITPENFEDEKPPMCSRAAARISLLLGGCQIGVDRCLVLGTLHNSSLKVKHEVGFASDMLRNYRFNFTTASDVVGD